jgi:hypothetical protein
MKKKYVNTLVTSEDGKWVGAIDCHLCKSKTPTKETHIIPVDYEYFGVKGYTHVQVCKQCHREKQLSKLI